MIVNQANLRGLNISYSTAYQKAFDGVETNYQKIATTVQSSTGEEGYKWLGQMPQMKEWVGEREIQSLAAYDYSIKNKPFEMTVSVSRDDIEDDKYGVYTPMFQNMGECAATHPDILVFDALQNGFKAKCYDGEPFFSKTHKVGEKTYSNLGTAKLSPESYGVARSSIMSIKGDKGKSLRLVPNLLVVSPQNEEMGRRILKAEIIDNTSNIYKDSAELLVDPSLSEKPDAWYLLCTGRALKPIIFQERKKIKFTSLTKDTDTNVFMNNEFIYGADGRCNVGYGFWQMAYASDGTAPLG